MKAIAFAGGIEEDQPMTGILVADDYEVLRSELKSILESRGYSVTQACNGIELLAILKQGTAPDALILDITMPKMSGIDALGEIRRTGCELKVLIMTMHKEPELLCRSFRAGADGYMLKESIAKELIPGLQDVLDGKIYISPAMQKELPDTCNVKAFAGQKFSPEFIHCK
jgi:DNA-binding NarL/FixJ family response regulator